MMAAASVKPAINAELCVVAVVVATCFPMPMPSCSAPMLLKLRQPWPDLKHCKRFHEDDASGMSVACAAAVRGAHAPCCPATAQ